MGSSKPKTVESTTVQRSEPPAYAQPYIQEFLSGAQQRYQSDAPEFFPGQTYVGFSPETEAGLSGITAGAQGGSPIAGAGADEYLKTIRGDYLSPESNPFLQGAIDAAINPIQERLMQETLPAISGQFSRAGRYGSGAHGNEMLQAGRDAVRGMSEATSNIAYQNYLGERGRQLGAAQGAPDYALRRFDDLNQLLGVGAQREDLSARALQDQIARFDFEQNQPQLKLGEYGGNIRQGVFGGTTTGTQQTPYFPGNPLLGGAGALATGAGALGALGAKPFGK